MWSGISPHRQESSSNASTAAGTAISLRCSKTRSASRATCTTRSSNACSPTGLSLQGASRLIEDVDARQRVESAVDDLDLTVRHIRTVIFDVATPRLGAESTRGRVLAARTARRGALGFKPGVVFQGPVDSQIPDDFADDLIATLREALSNVDRATLAHAVTSTSRSIAMPC